MTSTAVDAADAGAPPRAVPAETVLAETVPAAHATMAELDGPAPCGAVPSLEEIVRPFAETRRGITFLDGSNRRTVTYAELAALAAAVAVRLRAAGVRPGDRVAGTADNDIDSVLLLMAVWSLGAAFVSLPPPSRRDAGRFAERFGGLLASCGCGFLVTGEPDSQLAARAGLRVIPAASLRGLPPLPRGAGDAQLGDIALIQFTSGSVSAPKGVAIGSRALARHAAVLRRTLEASPERDRVVSWLPLYHDMGLVTMFLMPLAMRGDLVLMPPASFAFGPARWLNTLARERGTLTAAPDFAYRMAATVPYDAGLDLSCVRVALNGGERINRRTLEEFHRATEPFGLRREAVFPCYGLAENVVGVTTKALDEPAFFGPDGHVSVGHPVAGVSVRAPEGPPAGPLQLKGEFLFEGYYTGDGFVPTAPGQWHDTGDEGFVRDGRLYVIGRRAEVVCVAGRNVFAEDVEAAVHDSQGADIRACAAFRLEGADQQFGLMLEVPPRPARTPGEIRALGAGARAAVREAVGVRVATVLLVRPGTIPRTTSGKVQRSHCRALQAEGQLARKLLAAVE
jgi:acyl-CoA synthetase (AMP-forming)/AMP-acid ligase II